MFFACLKSVSCMLKIFPKLLIYNYLQNNLTKMSQDLGSGTERRAGSTPAPSTPYFTGLKHSFGFRA